MVRVTFDHVTKRFGDVVAVDDVSLVVEKGELFFLLGPSGCGKTTLLRMVAGFYAPEGGRVLFDDRDMTRVPPHKRNTGMVFQNYALWPHMTVAENVAYGLEVRDISAKDREDRVRKALETVRMDAPRREDAEPAFRRPAAARRPRPARSSSNPTPCSSTNRSRTSTRSFDWRCATRSAAYMSASA